MADDFDNVVPIGDAIVRRERNRPPKVHCGHRRIAYSLRYRTVTCEDCKAVLDTFDVFLGLVKQFESAWGEIKRRLQAVREAEHHALLSRAAKKLDKMYRSRSMAPSCPHCHGVLLPEDVMAMHMQTSVSMERKRREWEGRKRERNPEDGR